MGAIALSRYRAGREQRVEVGRYSYTVRRPTDLEVARAGGIGIDFAVKCVVGWDLKESDLVAGGDPEPADFDTAIFAEWIADRPDDWKPIVDAVINAYQKHKEQAADRGNG